MAKVAQRSLTRALSGLGHQCHPHLARVKLQKSLCSRTTPADPPELGQPHILICYWRLKSPGSAQNKRCIHSTLHGLNTINLRTAFLHLLIRLSVSILIDFAEGLIISFTSEMQTCVPGWH